MSNPNLKPVVLIHGIAGSRLVSRDKNDDEVLLWINLIMIQQGADTNPSIQGENIDLQSSPEVVGDTPDYKINPQEAKEPNPWWKDNMLLKEDGITPAVDIDKKEQSNCPEKGKKAVYKLLPDAIPDFERQPAIIGPIVKDNRYMGTLIKTLEDKGYKEIEDYIAAPYDWRTSFKGLNQRYDYFNNLKTQIEALCGEDKARPVTIVAHSMGNRITQYFLQWVKNSHPGQEGWGQDWIDTYIERYIAMAPPFLGAPLAVRMLTSNEPIKMGDLALSGMRKVLQSFSSLPWLLPLPQAELGEYFNTKDFVYVTEDSSPYPQDIKTTLTNAGAANTTLKYQEDYKNDENFSGKEKDYGSKAVECPPVGKLDVIYATGTPTEIGAYYNVLGSELILDIGKTEDGEQFKVVMGKRYETSQTTQKIDGTQNSGDGTVPYASLVYFKEWQKNPPANTIITEHHLTYDDAADVAGHDRIVKDKKGINTILGLLNLPPINRL